MMHYFQGMEVWQSVNGISLGQGKYAVEILKRFGMMECKSMVTPMASNLKLLSDASSELVDATMYHQMIGSLMYLKNTRPEICFTVNVVRIYPYYRGRNGSLKPIGHKGRFLPLENSKKNGSKND